MARLFKNGSLAKADSTTLDRSDILVSDDGIIESIGPNLDATEGVEVVDCDACIILPGMFDLHVHAREPGEEDKETIATCGRAALHGGVTGVVLMPDTIPAIDSGNLVKSVHDLVSEAGLIPMLQAGCLTKRRSGEELAGFSGMVSQGVPMLTDSDRSVLDADLLRRCMEYAKDFGVLVTSFCDTPSLTKRGVINEGRTSYRLGLPGSPSISQDIAIARDIALARYTGANLHIQQVSTKHGLDAITAAKNEGIEITCEISPHHLIFTEEDVDDYDTARKLNPPLRESGDREAMLEGLKNGTIDAIATDHAPHTQFDKSADFAGAPFGATGLETAVLSIYDRFIRTGEFGWDVLVQLYSSTPRKIVGQAPVSIEEGEKAEFFVFDPNAETTITADYLRTKNAVTPFLGDTLAGAIRETVYAYG